MFALIGGGVGVLAQQMALIGTANAVIKSSSFEGFIGYIRSKVYTLILVVPLMYYFFPNQSNFISLFAVIYSCTLLLVDFEETYDLLKKDL